MKRFELLFPAQMLTWLRKEAKRRGIGICEVIRALVQREIDKK